MIKMILSDLDGVIRLFPKERATRIEKSFNLPEGTLLKVAFQKSLIDPVVSGKISDREWRKQIEDQVTEKFGAPARDAVIEWSSHSGEVDQRIMPMLLRYRSVVKLGLLTNATSRLNEDLENLGIKKHFDFIFNSSEIGFFKPDPRIYKHVLSECKLRPEQILFIDDSKAHCEAAEALGFQTHFHSTIGSLEDRLLNLKGI